MPRCTCGRMVGKVALARAAPLNHTWAIAFLFTPRGLRTRLLSQDARTFSFTFDFLDHQLVIETSDGVRRALVLAPRSVAEFYHELMTALDGMGLPVRIWSMPVELASPIRFEENTGHQSYDREYVERWWRILVQVHEVFTECRSAFIGKCSPVQFFWGAFDVAVTRFSGRPAPPRDGPTVPPSCETRIHTKSSVTGSGLAVRHCSSPRFTRMPFRNQQAEDCERSTGGCVLPPGTQRVHSSLRSGARRCVS